MQWWKIPIGPRMPMRGERLPGRPEPLAVPEVHRVSGNRIKPPFPEDTQVACFALGCFWGAERHFWEIPGVYSTAAGYQGGFTPNPTYEEVCTGRTGHAEAVQVVFDPTVVGYATLLSAFWEGHDPTHGMRQGRDIGTQYRSAIYTFGDWQRQLAEASRGRYQRELNAAGYGPITTEIAGAYPFYHAEEHHQQYLARNPGGYCGLGGTGVLCPSGIPELVE